MSFGLIPPDEAAIQADLERRFAGLRRLYGDDGYLRLRALRLAVVGLGGVGSWVAEALARCGVAAGAAGTEWPQAIAGRECCHAAARRLQRHVRLHSLVSG